MPQPARRKLADRILIEFIEADVDIGFGLVDEAKAYRLSGHPEFGERALRNAANILTDIELRIQQLGDSQSTAFLLLVAELRKEIEEAQNGTS